jgi:hypothetical protein
MDRKNSADFWLLMHPDGDHASVPIMAVNHLGFPTVPGEFR